MLAGLDAYAKLRQAAGAAEVDAFLSSERGGEGSLRVLLADAMLARDKLDSAIRWGVGRERRGWSRLQ